MTKPLTDHTRRTLSEATTRQQITDVRELLLGYNTRRISRTTSHYGLGSIDLETVFGQDITSALNPHHITNLATLVQLSATALTEQLGVDPDQVSRIQTTLQPWGLHLGMRSPEVLRFNHEPSIDFQVQFPHFAAPAKKTTVQRPATTPTAVTANGAHIMRVPKAMVPQVRVERAPKGYHEMEFSVAAEAQTFIRRFEGAFKKLLLEHPELLEEISSNREHLERPVIELESTFRKGKPMRRIAISEEALHTVHKLTDTAYQAQHLSQILGAGTGAEIRA